ncbi:MAG: hypothetical protein Q8936_11900 [Bacillota bacterium]|nr:hypothetical protein [Bacillota bacterium]
MKTVIVVIGIIIMILVLASIYILKKIFHPLEMFAYFMVGTIFTQQIYTVITINMHLVKASNEIFSILPTKVVGMVVYPISGMWTIAALYSKRINIFWKIVIIILYFILHSMDHIIRLKLGYIKDIHWSLFPQDVLKNVFILLGTFLFSLFFRKLLRERKIIS